MRTLVLILVAALTACGGGGGSGNSDEAIPQIPAVPSNASTVSAETDASSATVPAAEEPTNAFLLQALGLCLGLQHQTSTDAFAGCSHSSRHEEVIDWSIALYEEVVARDPRLVGRDLPIRRVRAGDTLDLSGNVLNLAICDPGPGQARLNAFATNDLVVMLVPLLDAFHEGACAYAELVALEGGDPAAVDPALLLAALGTIFHEVNNGNPYSLIAEAECDQMIASDPIAFEAYWGAVSFVVFHEIAHANLRHGVVQCLVRIGVGKILSDAGVMLTTQQESELELAFAKLSRSLETQSDIYSSTILEQLGFSSSGMGLFVLGMIGRQLLDGTCDPSLPSDQLLDCVTGDSPTAGHPPLDVRANIAVRILEDGEDLTPLLELLSALDP